MDMVKEAMKQKNISDKDGKTPIISNDKLLLIILLL
jgi:hypothetical protein